MRLRRKVQNGINLFLAEDIADKIRGSDISLDKLKVRFVQNLRQVFKASAVIELVVNDDVVLRVLCAQQNGNMRRNETCNNDNKPV